MQRTQASVRAKVQGQVRVRYVLSRLSIRMAEKKTDVTAKQLNRSTGTLKSKLFLY